MFGVEKVSVESKSSHGQVQPKYRKRKRSANSFEQVCVFMFMDNTIIQRGVVVNNRNRITSLNYQFFVESHCQSNQKENSN